jgi:hypothetical protein
MQVFRKLADAKDKIESWRNEYNRERPHIAASAISLPRHTHPVPLRRRHDPVRPVRGVKAKPFGRLRRP